MNQIPETSKTHGLDQDQVNRLLEKSAIRELLRDQTALWRILFEEAWDGIVVLDQSGKVYEANRRFADLLGYSLDEVAGLHVWDWDKQFNESEVLAMIRQISDVGHQFETRHVRKDGGVIDVELWNNVAVFRGQKLIFCFCRDVTERKKTEARITFLATTDSLTGMLNRSEFSRLLAHEVDRTLRYETPLSMIMYDIDHFKQVNDAFGHGAGEEVLRVTSQLVSGQIRRVDRAARWSGEEFLVLMPQTDLAGASCVAEMLRRAIAGHHFKTGQMVTASFGVTEFSSQDDADTFLKRVDKALRLAQEKGRNCVESLGASAG